MAAIAITDDDEHEVGADRVRYNHKRTQKGWGYETTVVVHRLPGEDGKAWMARSQMALRQARDIAAQERDDRDNMDRVRATP